MEWPHFYQQKETERGEWGRAETIAMMAIAMRAKRELAVSHNLLQTMPALF